MINYIDQFSPFPSDCWQLLGKETEERTKFAHFRYIFVFHIFPTHRAGVSGTPSSRPSATPVFQTASVPQRSTRPRTLTWRAQCGYGGNGMASHFQLRLLRLTSHVLAKRSARCRGKVARIEPKDHPSRLESAEIRSGIGYSGLRPPRGTWWRGMLNKVRLQWGPATFTFHFHEEQDHTMHPTHASRSSLQLIETSSLSFMWSNAWRTPTAEPTMEKKYNEQSFSEVMKGGGKTVVGCVVTTEQIVHKIPFCGRKSSVDVDVGCRWCRRWSLQVKNESFV